MAMDIPDDVRKDLGKAFLEQDDSLGRALWFLSDSIAKKCAEPYIRSLQMVPNPKVFKIVAERMVEDSKKVDNDENYRQVMYDVWNNFLKDKLTECPDGGQKLALAIRPDSTTTVAQFCFLRAVARLPPESYMKLATSVSAMSGPVAVYGGKALAIAQKAQPVVRVALVVVALAWNVIKNIRRWWKGEISGKRCLKNIIDCGIGVAAGIGGGVGGEMMGASAGFFVGGPVGAAFGAVIGAVVGGVLVSITAETLSDWLTQLMFGLPKSEALENAYNFLSTSPNASNSDINSNFRHLALKYHPDKGGDAKKWTQLQYSMAIIREVRGEP